ncbi:hypothetical protein M9Y10_045238 [Tritrichomonas musculus]|uniref:Sec23/Sec24 trunk domain containing protein n=1 Tax=Tritrichomonas musculus TaxID=1915356 RepID=A0ABR2JUN6_9EUKA
MSEYEDVDDEPILNPISQINAIQEANHTPNAPKISQLYDPVNPEISPEDSNPWTSPSLSLYAESNSSSVKSSKTLNVDFFNPNQTKDTLLPLYIRPVSTFFPVSSATRQLTNIPCALIITPGLVDQNRVPITDLSNSSLIRCPRCAAHINPYCDISADGKHWKCAICSNDTIFLSGNVHVANVPKKESSQIYSPLNPKKKEIKTIADLYSQGSSDFRDSLISHEDRLEISSPVVDIIAPQNYNVHKKAGPSFLFIFDLSYNSIAHSFAQIAASSVLSIVNEISDDTYISLITIDDKLTIFDFKKNNRTTYPELEPEILKDELTTHVCKLKDESGCCKNRFISVLKEIQNIKIDISKASKRKVKSGNCIGSAFEVVPHILKDIGGIVMAFIFGTCDVGPRAVSERSKDEMVNENILLHMPKTDKSAFYGGIARLYARSMISLHLFAASKEKEFIDLPVIGIPCGLTGGRCHFFGGFDPLFHFSEIHREIYRTLTTKYFWDATLRLRNSSSLTIGRIHANCQIASQNTISLPVIAAEDSFVFEFALHMHITTDTLPFQFELEWNDDNRRRMIRVFTFSLPVTDDPLRILKHVDESALITVLMKRTISSILSNGVTMAKQFFIEEAVKIICVTSGAPLLSKNGVVSNRQINIRLFPNLKSFSKMAFALIQSSYFSLNFPNGPDGRFSQILQMRSIGIVDLILFIYPRLLTVDNEILPLCKKSLDKYKESLPDPNNYILIVHSCNAIFIWAKSRDVLVNELSSTSDPNVIDHSGVIDVDKITSQKLKDLIHSCWIISRKYLLSFAIYGDDIIESLLIEESLSSGFTYASYIQSLMKKA